MAEQKKKQVAVLFGGRSVEHEISVISGLQLINALDCTTINPIPVYLAQDGRWFTGDSLLEKSFYKTVPQSLSTLKEVTLLPKPGVGGLTVLNDPTLTFFDDADDQAKVIPVDVYIPAFHGQFGEDGCLQGLFEMADVIYTGSKVMSLAATMNKYICKSIAREHGIPVLPGIVVRKVDALKDISTELKKITETDSLKKFPLFVKPVNLGSSVGINKAESLEQLTAALLGAFKYDEEAIVEPCVANIMEINVSVIDADQPYASVVEIPVSATGVLSYEEKYLRGGSKKTGESQGMASLTRVIDPQDLDPRLKAAATEYAVKLFKVLKCSGVARLDFIVDTATGELFFNELNSLPGSLAFYLWAKSTPQLLYTDMLNKLIDRAIELKYREKSLTREIKFRALAQ